MKKQIAKKTLSILLVLAITLALMPTFTLPVRAGIGSSGRDIDLEDPNPPASGDGWTYDWTTRTYTIRGVTGLPLAVFGSNAATGARIVIIPENFLYGSDETRVLLYPNVVMTHTYIDDGMAALIEILPNPSNPYAYVDLFCEGNVKLNNENGQAIYVHSDATLYINGDIYTTNSSSLEVSSTYGAGIGGGAGDNGTIVISNFLSDSPCINIVAQGAIGCAGIGGGLGGSGGNIYIGGQSEISNGGIISKGGPGGAGIGGGYGGSGGNIDLGDVSLIAIGGEGFGTIGGGAGIGGGSGGAGGFIKIGGTIDDNTNINATGGGYYGGSGYGGGAGIGGGYLGSGGEIDILFFNQPDYFNKITATGNAGGAGIGGGKGGQSGTIGIEARTYWSELNNLTITASGSGGGAGIGGGFNGAYNSISITGIMSLAATGGSEGFGTYSLCGAGIGGGAGQSATNGMIIIDTPPGCVTAEGGHAINGDAAAIGTGNAESRAGTPVLPAAPGNFTVSKTDDTATLSWSTLSVNGLKLRGDAHYEVSSDGGAIWVNVPLGQTFYTFGSLTPGESYDMRVRGVFQNGYGVSAALNATMDAFPPVFEGPEVVLLPYGYAETVIDEYILTGSEPLFTTKTSGDSKIDWDDAAKKLIIKAGLDAGEYTVTIEANNGIPPAAVKTVKVIVEDNPSNITGVTVIPRSGQAQISKGETQSFAAFVHGANVASARTVNWTVTGAASAQTVISADGVLTAGADETAAALTVKASSAANPALFDTVNVTLVNKTRIDASGVTMAGGVYRKTPYDYIGTPVMKDGGSDVTSMFTPVIEYYGTTAAGTVYGPTSQAPADAGVYVLTIATPADNPVYYGVSLFLFEISKKTVTVTADNQKIKWREPLPSPTYTVSGFVAPDSETGAFAASPVPRYNVSDSLTAGKSIIEFASRGVLNAAYAANYAMQYINGELSIIADELPEYQLLAVIPEYVYNGLDRRVITLSGANLHRTAMISFTGPSGQQTFDIANISGAYTLNSGNTLMTIDLAKLPGSAFNSFTDVGGYLIKLMSDTGYAAKDRSFKIADDRKYAPTVNGYLKIYQNSNRTFGVDMVANESEGNGTPLITIHGEIVDMGGGMYTVKDGCVINKALNYSGDPLTVTLSPSADAVSVYSEAYQRNALKYQGITVAANGFDISLNSANSYKRTRTSAGTDMKINIPVQVEGFQVFTVKTDVAYSLKLYDTMFSISGSMALDAILPDFFTVKAKATLHDMLMQNSTGLPPMYAEAEVSIAKGDLMAGNIEGASLAFKINTLPENLYKYINVKGDLDISNMIYLEGEFTFTWNTERMLFIPNKLDFFARLASGGVPLIPPYTLAYINGVGGGIDGLAELVYGQYSKVPPLKINVKGAVRDATGIIISVEKATFTVGLTEISAVANEATFLEIISLKDVGLRFGFLDPKYPSNIPDMYVRYTAGIGTEIKGIIGINGKIDFNTRLYGKYVEDTAGNIYKFFEYIFEGKNIADYPKTEYEKVVKDLMMLFDFSGSFTGEVYIDIKVVKGKATGKLAIVKEGMDVTLSGAVTAEANAVLGLVPLGSVGVGISYNITKNELKTWKEVKPAPYSFSGDLSFQSPISGNGYDEDVTFTNIRQVASMTLGQTLPGGIMLMSVSPSAITLNDDTPHGVELETDDPNAVIKVTAPVSVGDIFAGYPEGEIRNTDGEVCAAVTINNGKKTIVFTDGTIFTEGEARNVYTIKPVWELNEETGMYEGGFFILGSGDWSFNSDSNVQLNVLEISPMPDLTSVSYSNNAVLWTYEDNGADISDYNVKLLLCDPADGSVIADVTPYDTDENSLSDLGNGNADIAEAMKTIDSGNYFIMAQLVRENAECVSIAETGVFSYKNPLAPPTVTGVQASYAGNGLINVSWNAAAGADGYVVEILDTNGNKVEGVADIDVTDGTSVVISGGKVLSTLIDADTGEVEESWLAGLDFGETYTFNVRAYKETIKTDTVLGEARTRLYGLAGTAEYTLPLPVIPKLTVNVAGANIIVEDGMTIYAVNTLSPVITVTPDMQATTMIEWFDGGVWNGTFTEDGRYSLRVTATTAAGDSAEMAINLLVSTGYPEILIDQASLFGTNGQIVINGAVELGSDISGEGTSLTTDMGSFTYAKITDKLVTPVMFLATNASGNTTERVVEVLMTDTGAMTGIELRLAGGGNTVGIGHSADIELWGIFESGKEYVIDAEGAILSVTSGNSIALSGWSVTGLSEGASTITVEYQFDENTVLTATLELGASNIAYYMVTFDLAGGTRTGGGELTQAVISGGAATAPTVTRSGYTFDGWDKTFGNVTSDLTVTAQWTPVSGGDDDEGGNVIPPTTEPTTDPPKTDPPTTEPPTAEPPAPEPPAIPAKTTTINGITVVYTIDGDGIVTLKPTQTQIKQIIKASKNGNITIDLADITGVTVTGVILEADPAWFGAAEFKSLTLTLKGVGKVLIKANVFESLSKQNTVLQFTLKKGSLIFDILNASNGKSIGYDDPANPLFVSIPVNLAADTTTKGYVGVRQKTASGNLIMPYSVYKDDEIIFQTAATGAFDILYNAKTFTDTKQHWASPHIAFVSARGLFGGIGDDLFSPDTSMTRAMFAQVIANIEGIDLSAYGTSRFTDVAAGLWYAPAVEWAASAGIVSGYGGGLFGPEHEITREQMAVMLTNYAAYKGYELPAGAAPVFDDEAGIASWAYDAVKMIQAAGIVVGRPDNVYDPKATATRAEVTAIFARFIEAYIANAVEG